MSPHDDASRLHAHAHSLTHTHAHTHTQVFDPDFYVATTEQVPRMLMDFLIPPKGDEDGPFVGRLEVLFFCGGALCVCSRACVCAPRHARARVRVSVHILTHMRAIDARMHS